MRVKWIKMSVNEKKKTFFWIFNHCVPIFLFYQQSVHKEIKRRYLGMAPLEIHLDVGGVEKNCIFGLA